MNKKYKILFIVPRMDAGGAQKVLSIILKYISKDLFDITLCVLTDTGVFYDTVPESVEKVYLKISRVRYSGPKIYRFIKATSPDVVFVFDVNNLLLIVGLLTFFLPSKIKFITREVVVLSVFIKTYSLLKSFRRFLYRLMFKRFQLIVCQSNYMRDDLLTEFNVSRTKTIVIGNPVEFDKVLQAADVTTNLFEKDRVNLVAVGRIVHVKGYDLLIEALVLVKEPSIHLTIIGERTPENPGYNDYVLGLIKKYNLNSKVTFLGFQINPHKYIKQSDFLVISSRAEGFPNVAVESIALGIPVLAFNCPGGIGEIIEDGVNGWLVESGNVPELAKAIDRISKNHVRRNGISEALKEKNDVSIIIPQYEQTILTVLNL